MAPEAHLGISSRRAAIRYPAQTDCTVHAACPADSERRPDSSHALCPLPLQTLKKTAVLATERYRTGANSPSAWSTPSQNGWVWPCPQQYSPDSVQSSASAEKGVSGARVVDVIIAFLLASWLAGIGGSADSAALACKGLVAKAPRSKAAPYAREPGLTVRQRTLAPIRAGGCAGWTPAPRRFESSRHAATRKSSARPTLIQFQPKSVVGDQQRRATTANLIDGGYRLVEIVRQPLLITPGLKMGEGNPLHAHVRRDAVTRKARMAQQAATQLLALARCVPPRHPHREHAAVDDVAQVCQPNFFAYDNLRAVRGQRGADGDDSFGRRRRLCVIVAQQVEQQGVVGAQPLRQDRGKRPDVTGHARKRAERNPRQGTALWLTTMHFKLLASQTRKADFRTLSVPPNKKAPGVSAKCLISLPTDFTESW